MGRSRIITITEGRDAKWVGKPFRINGITVNGHSAGQLSDGGSVLGSGFPFRKPHKKLDKDIFIYI